MKIVIEMILVLLVSCVSSKLLEGPSDLLVAAGEPVTLPCRSSSSRAKVTWHKDGDEVEASPVTLLLPDGSLFLLFTSEMDTGIYSCTIADRHGIHKSQAATLTVLNKKEEIMKIWEKDEEDEEIVEAIEKEVEREKKLERLEEELELVPPFLELAIMLEKGTGLVQWRPVSFAVGYTVRVLASHREVTNITVEKDVDRVKLHNLALGVKYAVSIAVQLQNGKKSAFSAPLLLTPSSSSFSSSSYSSSSSVPTSVWIIAISVVVVLTLLTIFGVTVIFLRLRQFKRSTNASIHPEDGPPSTIWRSKRLSWIDPRWAQRDLKVAQSSPTALLGSEAAYDYASSSEEGSSSKHESSNHYAYIDICTEGRKPMLQSFGYR